MFRKPLAFLLILSWIALSGFDVCEDIRHFTQIELHGTKTTPISSTAPTGRLVNNIVETAVRSRLTNYGLLQQSLVPFAGLAPIISQRTSRLHLMYRVLLI